MRLFLLLAAVPVIEIALFIELGGWLGTWPTVGIVVLTALIGSVMLRRQGLKAVSDVQQRLASGEDPGRMLADGAMILFAGALLLTPGFFTDSVGFALLVPGFRTVVFGWVSRNIKLNAVHVGGGPGGGPASGMGAGMGTRTGFGGRQQTGGHSPRDHGDGRWQSGRGVTIDGDYSDVTPEDSSTPSDHQEIGRPERTGDR